MAESIISIRDLVVRYGTVQALADVSLELSPGRIIGIIGMNGSGKSSLFGAVMGSVKAASGDIRLFGGDPARARKRNLVSYVPQSEAVDWDFPISVAEVVMTGRYGRLGVTRRPRAADRDAVARAIDRVGLVDLAERQIGELSGGQRKRVFVARGIAQEATLMLLDEPFAGVDKGSEHTIVALLRGLAAEGRGILISTHDLAGVPELCDEVILLKNRVLFHGAPEDALAADRLALAFGLEPR
ncbi:metal ABC transporter ATP-binding protein [Marisediminicola antarctica]|uniref:ABC transporter n=1 Tax=Marisediminicola antarctica TaxID=674079 RepID=A0A7L5AK45_9MICO|nr:metal ABC transporter ATP-binding protein [Marisediminicola antarctica]QHO69491.1 ABC transporter [Marisediminicola antarctica]